jgi:hypothetical protein
MMEFEAFLISTALTPSGRQQIDRKRVTRRSEGLA